MDKRDSEANISIVAAPAAGRLNTATLEGIYAYQKYKKTNTFAYSKKQAGK